MAQDSTRCNVQSVSQARGVAGSGAGLYHEEKRARWVGAGRPAPWTENSRGVLFHPGGASRSKLSRGGRQEGTRNDRAPRLLGAGDGAHLQREGQGQVGLHLSTGGQHDLVGTQDALGALGRTVSRSEGVARWPRWDVLTSAPSKLRRSGRGQGGTSSPGQGGDVCPEAPKCPRPSSCRPCSKRPPEDREQRRGRSLRAW